MSNFKEVNKPKLEHWERSYSVANTIDDLCDTPIGDYSENFKKSTLDFYDILKVFETDDTDGYAATLYVRPKNIENLEPFQFAMSIHEFFASECSLANDNWIRLWWD